MATFSTAGIEAEIARFTRMGENVGEACTKAVKAGGKVLTEKLKEAAPVRTGGLQKSIKTGPVKNSAESGYYAEVKPTGNDEHGESYAKIGNILEYGRSNMPARPWFYNTEAEAESAVTEAMGKTFAEEMQKAGR